MTVGARPALTAQVRPLPVRGPKTATVLVLRLPPCPALTLLPPAPPPRSLRLNGPFSSGAAKFGAIWRAEHTVRGAPHRPCSPPPSLPSRAPRSSTLRFETQQQQQHPHAAPPPPPPPQLLRAQRPSWQAGGRGSPGWPTLWAGGVASVCAHRVERGVPRGPAQGVGGEGGAGCAYSLPREACTRRAHGNVWESGL